MIEEFVRPELVKLASLTYFMENSILEIRREANCHIFKEVTFSKIWIVGYWGEILKDFTLGIRMLFIYVYFAL